MLIPNCLNCIEIGNINNKCLEEVNTFEKDGVLNTICKNYKNHNKYAIWNGEYYLRNENGNIDKKVKL